MNVEYLEEGYPNPKTMPNYGEVNPVQPGDVYEFLYNVETRAGHTHPKGSLLCVHESTTRAPHDEISASGKNWICQTDFGVSTWATLEQCISRGLFKKVGGPP